MRIFAYPWDLIDHGVEDAVRRIQSWGFDSIAVATNYHEAKLFLPDNPRRKVVFSEEGRTYFKVDSTHYEKSVIQPEESQLLQSSPNMWQDIAQACKDVGVTLVAWTICLHNASYFSRYPMLYTRNVFGDFYNYSLCPSNPQVRDFVRQFIKDVSNLPGVGEIFLESLHFMDYEHGYQHEMTGALLSLKAKMLLGICFCEDCCVEFEKRGIDVKEVRRLVAEEIAREVEAPTPDTAISLQGALVRWHQFALVLQTRREIISQLISEIRDETALPLTMFTPGSEWAWSNGIDFKSLSDQVNCFEMYHYTECISELASRVEALRPLIGNADIRVSIRAGWPDTKSASDLLAKVRYLKTLNIKDFTLYNYGQVPRYFWDMLTQIKIKSTGSD